MSILVLRSPEQSSKAKEAFKDVPWALEMFDDPTLSSFANESRTVKPEGNADTFVGKTLATEDTIKAWQSFKKLPDSTYKHGQFLSLLSIGSGVNGHINTSHGGFVSLMLDEALGLAAENSRPLDKITMTAYLKVDYKKPVTTPSIVLCRAWVEKTEGKKLFLRGTVENGEEVLSIAEGLFIVMPRKILRGNL
ncbi:thioesterase family protein-like protein [Calycina marina]|uniref:Thioesterase family protein-like protein n=1 Tax=Calycina marina TaxID=1763456 RepID=A0A9P7YYM2_9HELO|nr:thioesterase family protein-like protein [Calycina marina]